MFTDFFYACKKGGLPVSITEYLSLIDAVKAGCANYSVDDFYVLARTALVKDEKNLDKFDRVFAASFNGIEWVGEETVTLPEDWLRKLAELHLSQEEMEKIKSLGDWDEIMETLKSGWRNRKNVTRAVTA